MQGHQTLPKRKENLDKKKLEWIPLQLASFIFGNLTLVFGICLLVSLGLMKRPLIALFDPAFEITIGSKVLKFVELSIKIVTG